VTPPVDRNAPDGRAPSGARHLVALNGTTRKIAPGAEFF
jgi:hypothetical protein